MAGFDESFDRVALVVRTVCDCARRRRRLDRSMLVEVEAHAGRVHATLAAILACVVVVVGVRVALVALEEVVDDELVVQIDLIACDAREHEAHIVHRRIISTVSRQTVLTCAAHVSERGSTQRTRV